jgi:hypothetical protein
VDTEREKSLTAENAENTKILTTDGVVQVMGNEESGPAVGQPMAGRVRGL